MIEYNGNYFYEEDRDLLVDDIKNMAPELLEKYSPDELASLYCDFSEEVWSAQWEDNAEGQFIEWLKKTDSVRVAAKTAYNVLPAYEQVVKDYINSLPKIYLVGCWARYGVMEYPLAKWDEGMPYVYDYNDHNGTADNYELVPITWVTTGQILVWTESKGVAEAIADAMNLKLGE